MTAPETSPAKGPLALFGAPTDIGAGHRGGSMAPEALRVAGIEAALRGLGFEVADWGNLTGPLNPDLPPVDGYRHLEEVTAWCRSVRDTFYEALRTEYFPILLGGDHCLAIGSVAALARHCAEVDKPLSVLWLDAHADFNTPETSPTGNIHGMPVAVIAGIGPPSLTDLAPTRPMLDPARIVQVGIRSVDSVEKRKVVDSKLVVHDMRLIDENGMRETMARILDQLAALGGHVHVSFDVDFLDPAIAPGVGTTVAHLSGGPALHGDDLRVRADGLPRHHGAQSRLRRPEQDRRAHGRAGQESLRRADPEPPQGWTLEVERDTVARRI
jgi:arginase